jgi:protein TonB
MPLFVMGSFAAHGVAYAALSNVHAPATLPRLPSAEVTFVVEAPEPAPEPALAVVAEPPPAPMLVQPVARPVKQVVQVKAPKPEAAVPAPTPATEAPPPLATLGVSDGAGLAVAGQVGTGGSPTGSLTGSVNGVPGGTGGTGSQPSTGTPGVDLRRLTSEWAAKVSQAIGTRAVHAYPRTALRAHVQGTVLLTVRIGTAGQIETVALARSSGFPQLDEAALAAARELGEVPAPPAALHRYLRPFPVPVTYVIRS